MDYIRGIGIGILAMIGVFGIPQSNEKYIYYFGIIIMGVIGYTISNDLPNDHNKTWFEILFG